MAQELHRPEDTDVSNIYSAIDDLTTLLHIVHI
ncbi:hypothetical protein EYZ11_005074 [Aspergillus tanneri]|uniref:Uncharacterized protein n=1 Tax=Aspergillus tanneri TaxID=1220188 RepID=A0A4S3JJ84_9EURO|nr:hypothetical protein EYZ11_005074 [Aspergillus tanneri]